MTPPPVFWGIWVSILRCVSSPLKYSEKVRGFSLSCHFVGYNKGGSSIKDSVACYNSLDLSYSFLYLYICVRVELASLAYQLARKKGGRTQGWRHQKNTGYLFYIPVLCTLTSVHLALLPSPFRPSSSPHPLSLYSLPSPFLFSPSSLNIPYPSSLFLFPS